MQHHGWLLFCFYSDFNKLQEAIKSVTDLELLFCLNDALVVFLKNKIKQNKKAQTIFYYDFTLLKDLEILSGGRSFLNVEHMKEHTYILGWEDTAGFCDNIMKWFQNL